CRPAAAEVAAKALATSLAPRPRRRWPRTGEPWLRARRNRSKRSRRRWMRRTTICRSDRAALLALVAGLLAGVVAPSRAAQDRTHARADSAPADTVTAVAPDTSMVPDTTQAVVEAPPPAPTETYQTIFERRRTPGEAVKDVLRAYANPLYRPLRRGEFYAAGFLTENERLPW